jgi:hypothetical protein
MIKVNLFGYLVKVIVGVCDGIPTVDRCDSFAWFTWLISVHQPLPMGGKNDLYLVYNLITNQEQTINKRQLIH